MLELSAGAVAGVLERRARWKSPRKRKTKVQSWYLDVNLLASYWGQERVYHHTAPISMNYALHEALRLVLEEGLENRWQRHQRMHDVLIREGATLGLRIARRRVSTLATQRRYVPEGVDEATVRKALLTISTSKSARAWGRSKEKSGASV